MADAEDDSPIQVWEVLRAEGWRPYPDVICKQLQDCLTFTFQKGGVSYTIDTAHLTETSDSSIRQIRKQPQKGEESEDDEEIEEEEVPSKKGEESDDEEEEGGSKRGPESSKNDEDNSTKTTVGGSVARLFSNLFKSSAKSDQDSTADSDAVQDQKSEPLATAPPPHVAAPVHPPVTMPAPSAPPAVAPPNPKPKFNGVGMWQYQNEHGGWNFYPDDVNAKLRENSIYSYSTSKWPYTIDRNTMTQTNTSTGTVRPIRQFKFLPGKYKFLVPSWVKSRVDTSSAKVRDVNKGDKVTVTMVVCHDNRVRGQVQDGFITLYNLDKQKMIVSPKPHRPKRQNGTFYQWQNEYGKWNDYPHSVQAGLASNPVYTYTYKSRQYRVDTNLMQQTNLQTFVNRPVRIKPRHARSSSKQARNSAVRSSPPASPTYNFQHTTQATSPKKQAMGPQSQWQYLNEHNQWCDYPNEVNVALRNCPSGNFTYTHSSGRAYNIDLNSNSQKNVATSVQRKVRMKPGTGSSNQAQKQWQYLHADGKWKNYPDDVNSALIAKLHQPGSSDHTYTAGNNQTYRICLATMKQTALSTGTVRKVRLLSGTNVQIQPQQSIPVSTPKPPSSMTAWESITCPCNCDTMEGLKHLFHQRQQKNLDWNLEFVAASKLEQPGLLQSFNPGSNMQLLFHGTDESKVANISIEGLKLSFGSNGYLGVGLYGAPDPRKAYTYSSGKHGRYIFLAAYNLDNAKSGAFGTDKFQEYSVNSDNHVVVLWMIKVKLIQNVS